MVSMAFQYMLPPLWMPSLRLFHHSHPPISLNTIWQIVFGTLPPDGFEEQHRRYGKSGKQASVASFFPVQGNPFSILDDEEGLNDQENRENYTPRKKVRTLPEAFVSAPRGLVCRLGHRWWWWRWGQMNAIWSNMSSPCENNPLPLCETGQGLITWPRSFPPAASCQHQPSVHGEI